MELDLSAERKRQHLELALNPMMQAESTESFNSWRLLHEALPDFDFSDVSLEIPGGRFHLRQTPFFVAAMTAGIEDSIEINKRLAEACLRRGWLFCFGSLRKDFEEKKKDSSLETVRSLSPDFFLVGNLGITQLAKFGAAAVSCWVREREFSALAIHLNALQESLQPEGTPQFRGALEELATLCADLTVPLIVKETGCGFSHRTVEKIISRCRVAALDVSGLGGTHWGRIEGTRSSEGTLMNRVSDQFKNWGIPTTKSLEMAKPFERSNLEFWSSGGVRTGVDAAIALALGASRVGFAYPALLAAKNGDQELDLWMQVQERALKTALFCTGCKTVANLREKGREILWRA